MQLILLFVLSFVQSSNTRNSILFHLFIFVKFCDVTTFYISFLILRCILVYQCLFLTDILEPSLKVFAAYLYLNNESDPLKKIRDTGK